MDNLDFKPSVRRVDDIVIVFRDKHSVIVSDGRSSVNFHRWFDRHQFDYSKFWKPFCQALHRRKHLSLSDCYALARRYQISTQNYTGEIDVLVQEIMSGS